MLEKDIFHRLCFENRAWKRSSDIVTDGALQYGKNHESRFCFLRTHAQGVQYRVETGSNISIPAAGTTGIAIMLPSIITA